ncbi:MAG: 2-phosphosulfolactate phosphatase [Gemmatimonadetes bacterium]|nr:2-phosphosulfolactate phosphatase [Gemmatimonadota bacterium]
MTRSVVEVLAGPHALPELELAERACVVIDVLRAGTTIAHALAAGARGVVPVATVEDAMRRAQSLGRESTLLGGERGCRKIDGFDLGNSPAEYVPEVVRGKTIVLSTTNGARGLAACARARRCVAGAFVNLSATVRLLAGEPTITLVCAGSGAHFSQEDFVCAGMLAERLEAGGARLDDGARAARDVARGAAGDLAAFLAGTDHGRRLEEAGFGSDLPLAADVDRFDFVPVLTDGVLGVVRPE